MLHRKCQAGFSHRCSSTGTLCHHPRHRLALPHRAMRKHRGTAVTTMGGYGQVPSRAGPGPCCANGNGEDIAGPQELPLVASTSHRITRAALNLQIPMQLHLLQGDRSQAEGSEAPTPPGPGSFYRRVMARLTARPQGPQRNQPKAIIQEQEGSSWEADNRGD